MSTIYDFGTPASATVGTPHSGKFPARPYPDAGLYYAAYVAELTLAAASVEPASFDGAASVLLEAYTRGARVFSCGNGGSAAIANHMQCDHVKGIRTGTDLQPRFTSLSSNVEILTAIANDLSYEEIFTYQLQSQSEPGDVLIAVSSSGCSPNIVRALTWARDNGLRTIALTGFSGGGARRTAEVAVHVDSTNYGIVEDLHQALTHALAQYLRQSRMTAGTISANVF